MHACLLLLCEYIMMHSPHNAKFYQLTFRTYTRKHALTFGIVTLKLPKDTSWYTPTALQSHNSPCFRTVHYFRHMHIYSYRSPHSQRYTTMCAVNFESVLIMLPTHSNISFFFFFVTHKKICVVINEMKQAGQKRQCQYKNLYHLIQSVFGWLLQQPGWVDHRATAARHSWLNESVTPRTYHLLSHPQD